MFIDSHCHLNFPELSTDIAAILAAMQEAEVDRALCISTSMEEFDQVHAIAMTYPNIWCSVGVHPENEGGAEPDVAALVKSGSRPRVVGVGETGLDYHDMQGRKGGRTIADMEWQRERFRVHIRAARQLGKPLIIHTRAAIADTLRLLHEEGEDGSAGQAGGVFHCFGEDEAVAREVLDMGYYISFSGIVTFKNARVLKEVARFVPLTRMLIETDSPYLAPVPHRGKVNNPSYVAHVARHIAELRGITPAEVGEATSRNFETLFSGVKQ